MSPAADEVTTSATAQTPAGAVSATVTTPKPNALGVLKQAMIAGGGFFGGGGLTYMVYELIREEPSRSFELLKSWGSQFVIAIFAMWTARAIFEKMTDRIGGAMDSIALEQRRQADAAELKAAKDDREAERIATLVEYSAQQSRQALEVVKTVSEVLNKISGQVDRIEQQAIKPSE